VAELFRVAWGLEVTASGLCQADERLAEELVEAFRNSVAVHADETGWRVGGQGAGLGVLTGPPSMGAGPMKWWWRSWGRGFRACG